MVVPLRGNFYHLKNCSKWCSNAVFSVGDSGVVVGVIDHVFAVGVVLGTGE